MRLLPRRLGGLALATLSLAATPARAATVPPWVLADSWTEVRTEHFTLVTNAGARVAVGLGRRLEQFGAALAVANPELRAFPALPTEVYAFRNQAGLDQFRSGEAENIPGFAAPTLLRNVIVLNAETEGVGRNSVICHEYTHVFTAANFPEMPLWLDEGLAEYYGTFKPAGTAFEVGHRRAWLMDWLGHNELADLDLVFAANNEAPVYLNDNPLRNTLYAQGWIMTRYLTDRRPADFHRFIELLRLGTPARRAFESRFPRAQWPALMSDLRRYVRDDFLDYRSVSYAPPRPVAPRIRALAAPEVLLRLGELLHDVSADGYAPARVYYAASLARDSSQARAWARLGLAADLAGDTARAELAYRRALRLAPDEALPNLLAGMGTVMRANQIASRDDADLVLAHAWLVTGRARLSRCLERAPHHPGALAAFGASYLPESELPPVAIRALEQAAADLPSRQDVAEDLDRARGARARWAWELPDRQTETPGAGAVTRSPASHAAMIEAMREAQREAEYQSRMSQAWRAGANGDHEQVVRWLLRARVMTSSTAEIDSMLVVERATLKLSRARRLATAGKLAAARDTIATLRGLPADHELTLAARQLRDELAARVEIDRALALAKAGDRKGARAAFESVSRMPVDESIRAYARQRLKDLDAAAAR